MHKPLLRIITQQRRYRGHKHLKRIYKYAESFGKTEVAALVYSHTKTEYYKIFNH